MTYAYRVVQTYSLQIFGGLEGPTRFSFSKRELYYWLSNMVAVVYRVSQSLIRT